MSSSSAVVLSRTISVAAARASLPARSVGLLGPLSKVAVASSPTRGPGSSGVTEDLASGRKSV